MDGGLAGGIGLDQGSTEHLGGAGDVADFIVYILGRNRGVLLPGGQRAYRGSYRAQRSHRAANHKQRRENPDQDTGRAERYALPLGLGQRPCEVARQHSALARAELAQQFGHPSDQTAFGPQNLLIEFGDLGLDAGSRSDRVSIGVGRRAKRGIIDRQRPHALRRLLCALGIVRQNRGGEFVVRREQSLGGGLVRHRGDGLLETIARRR